MYALVFLSGFTALVYQVSWQHYLAFLLGGDAKATSLVLAAFFLFMSIGYWTIGHLAAQRTKLVLYGVIEGGIGVYALISSQWFGWLQSHTFNLAIFPWPMANDFLLTSLLVALPTFLMGGTIPVLTHGLSHDFESSHRVHARIYGLNTLGAFVGAVASGFYLIEVLGLHHTLNAAGVLDLAVAVAAFLLAPAAVVNRSATSSVADEAPPPSGTTSSLNGVARFGLYLISFCSGFYVFTLENLWIRWHTIAAGSSTYSFTTLVAVFILAIAAGSLWTTRWRGGPSLARLRWVYGALFISCVFIYLSVPQWPAWQYRLRLIFFPSAINFDLYCLVSSLFLFLLLFVPVALMGMNLPLLFAHLRSKRLALSAVTGRIYAVNALGCFLGSLLGGYLLLRWIPSALIFKLALALILLSAVIVWLMDDTLIKGRRQLSALATIAAALTVLLILPAWPARMFLPGLFSSPLLTGNRQTVRRRIADWRREDQLVWSQEGPDGLVGIIRRRKKIYGTNQWNRVLFINGRADASTLGDAPVRSMNVLIPLSVAPNVKDVFIVGAGMGLSAGIAGHFNGVNDVKVAEISQSVLNALSHFRDNNLAADENKKIEFDRGDALRLLPSFRQKFGVIVCEPSQLWVVGVDKLFSKEFLRQAKGHLRQDGVYAQWLPLFDIDPRIFLNALATFQSVFPHVTLWGTRGYATLIVASNKPLSVPASHISQKFETNQGLYQKFGFTSADTILTRQILTEDAVRELALRANHIYSMDDSPLVFEAGRALFAQEKVNLQKLLEDTLTLPAPETADNHMLIGNWRKADDLPAVEEGLAYIEKNYPKPKRYEFPFHRRRLEILKTLQRPSKAALASKAYKQYAYLTGQMDQRALLNNFDPQKDLRPLIHRAKVLTVAQLPFSLARLARLIQKECPKESCASAKKYMVENFAPRPVRASMTFSSLLSRWLSIGTL